jgi:hypothetical protein
MHRIQPKTQKGYLLVAHTAFSKGSKDRGHGVLHAVSRRFCPNVVL